MAASLKDHFIVAIGASAGGLEAIHDFFDHMPESNNLSFVIIQHLSPDYKSLLVDLVSRHTHMKVFEAKDGLPIHKNCIYVIPNNKLITIKKHKLLLADKGTTKMPNNAIDVFLYSLAKEKKQQAIAVILSGTGTDGTKGIEAIKEAGGIIMVQDPATARFDGMPNSAIQSGNADFVLRPSQMPEELVNSIHSNSHALLPNGKIEDPLLDEIFDLIHNEVGHDFHFYKTPTIYRRITRRMVHGNYSRFEDYMNLLRNDAEERKQLGKDFLIGVTRFFRDEEAFAILREKVIPAIIAEKEPGGTIKVWVSACSTGEEAYSIAILINEVLEKQDKSLDVKIFATDLDETSIEIAAKGVYPASIEKDIESLLLKKYFVNKAKGNYVIHERIRKQIVFAAHNIAKDPPFIKNDLVTCRNMLIYMNPVLQQRIYGILLFAANKNGYLFLGSSESASYIKDNISEISNKWKLYKKIKHARLGGYSPASFADRTASLLPKKNALRQSGNGNNRDQQLLWDELKPMLDEELNIAAFYIDQQFDIREAIGNYDNFIALPKKSLHLNLLKMIPGDVSFAINAAIRKSWKEPTKINLRNLKHKKGQQVVSWQVFIQPSQLQPYTILVLVESDAVEAKHIEDPFTPPSAEEQAEYIQSLEAELSETKSNLQQAIEDQETVNEELQSSNEELLSANEELQSSNEELQSLNEELHTLNTEHQLKIRELLELNDDLNNYFRSTDIGQVFLDKELKIRKFNPASARMINFIDSDIGRPISHISNNIRYEHLQADIAAVLKTNMVIEKEVQLVNGKNMLMRIMPYLTRDNLNGGVIISFVDITIITDLNNIIRGIFNSSHSAIFAFKSIRDTYSNITDFILLTANAEAIQFLGGKDDEIIGKYLKRDILLLTENGLFEKYLQVVQTGIKYHTDIYFESTQKWFEVTAARMMDGFAVTFTDISEKKIAEQKLRKNYVELVAVKDNLKKLNTDLENKVTERTHELSESEERFRLVARATNDALWDWNFVNNQVWWGDAFFKQFGYGSMADLVNRHFWLNKIHPDDRAQVEESLHQAINTGKNQWVREYRFLKENGEYAYILDRAYVLQDEYGTPYRMLGSMFDLTEQKKAEQEIARINASLEQKVAQRTQQLQQINEELETSNNDLQQFASVASHDLQEPLRKILMHSRFIKDKFEHALGSDVKESLHKIIHSSGRMKSLISDILNFSRLSNNRYEFIYTDLHKMITEILDDFEVTIREKDATITIDELPCIDAIPGQMRQVFHNLLANALKFSRPDTLPVVQISGGLIKEKSFDSPLATDGDFCRISVKDNGIGFDEKFTASIFNLFQRLHSKDKYEGSGIGLAITKKIVEKHQGLITAHSREGSGAEFIIILPVKQTIRQEVTS
jgi:two-component system, chemotaxis family, CheB/CheR fusion protein